LVLVALAVAGASGAQLASAAPAGLADTTLPAPVSNPLNSPTAIAPILDSGRALVLEKGGTVRILQSDGTLLAPAGPCAPFAPPLPTVPAVPRNCLSTAGLICLVELIT